MATKEEAAYFDAYRELGDKYTDLAKKQGADADFESAIGGLSEDDQFLARLYQDAPGIAASLDKKSAEALAEKNRQASEQQKREYDEKIKEQERIRKDKERQAKLEEALHEITPEREGVKVDSSQGANISVPNPMGGASAEINVPGIQKYVAPKMVTMKGADLIRKLGGSRYLQGVQIYEDVLKQQNENRKFDLRVADINRQQGNSDRNFKLNVAKAQGAFKQKDDLTAKRDSISKMATDAGFDEDQISVYHDMLVNGGKEGFTKAYNAMRADITREQDKRGEVAKKNKEEHLKVDTANREFWVNKKRIDAIEAEIAKVNPAIDQDGRQRSSLQKELHELQSSNAKNEAILGGDPTKEDIWAKRKQLGLSAPGGGGTGGGGGGGGGGGTSAGLGSAQEPGMPSDGLTLPSRVIKDKRDAATKMRAEIEKISTTELDDPRAEDRAQSLSASFKDPELAKRFRLRYTAKLSENGGDRRNAFAWADSATAQDFASRHDMSLKMQMEQVDALGAQLEEKYKIKLSDKEKGDIARDGMEGDTWSKGIVFKVENEEYKKKTGKDIASNEMSILKHGYMLGTSDEFSGLSKEFKDHLTERGGMMVKSLGAKTTENSFAEDYKIEAKTNPFSRTVASVVGPMLDIFSKKNWVEGLGGAADKPGANWMSKIVTNIGGNLVSAAFGVFHPITELGQMAISPTLGALQKKGTTGVPGGFEGIVNWWNGRGDEMLKNYVNDPNTRQNIRWFRKNIADKIGAISSIPVLGPYGAAAMYKVSDGVADWVSDKVFSFMGDGDADLGFMKVAMDPLTWIGMGEIGGLAKANKMHTLVPYRETSLVKGAMKASQDMVDLHNIEKKIFPGEQIRLRLGGKFAGVNKRLQEQFGKVMATGLKVGKDGQMISVVDDLGPEKLQQLFDAISKNVSAERSLRRGGVTLGSIKPAPAEQIVNIFELAKQAMLGTKFEGTSFADDVVDLFKIAKERDEMFSQYRVGDLLDEMAQAKRAAAGKPVPVTEAGAKAVEGAAPASVGAKNVASVVKEAAGETTVTQGKVSFVAAKPGTAAEILGKEIPSVEGGWHELPAGQKIPTPDEAKVFNVKVVRDGKGKVWFKDLDEVEKAAQKKTPDPNLVDNINSVTPGLAREGIDGKVTIETKPFVASTEIAAVDKGVAATPGSALARETRRQTYERWGDWVWNDIIKAHTWDVLPASWQRMITQVSSRMPKIYGEKELAYKRMHNEFLDKSQNVGRVLVEGLSAEERVLAQKILRSGDAMNPEIWAKEVAEMPGFHSPLAPEIGDRLAKVKAGFAEELKKVKDPNKFIDNVFYARDEIDRLSAQAAEMGLLDNETFFREVGRYVPRLYLEYELGDTFNRIAKKLGLGGLKLDRFTGRTLTEAEAAAKGYISQSGYAEARGIQQVGYDVATSKHFADVARESKLAVTEAGLKPGMESWVKVENQSELAQTLRNRLAIAKTPEDIRQLTGQLNKLKFGQLSGMYVHPDVWAKVNPMVDLRGESLKLYDALISKWKFGKTVLNPSTHGRNFITNTMMTMMSTGYGPLDPRGWKSFVSDIAEFRAGGDVVKRAVANGAMGKNYLSTELNTHLESLLKYAQDDTSPGLLGKLSGYFSKYVGDPAASWYQKSEHLHRFRLYRYAEQELKLAGPEAAAWAIKHGINYDDVGSAIRFARRVGPPFITWSAKALPLFAENLVRHPLVAAQFAALFTGVSMYAAKKQGWNDEDLERASNLMPDKIRERPYAGLSVMHLPWQDDRGNTQYLDLNYLLPFNDVGSLAWPGTDSWQSTISANPIIGSIVELSANKNIYTGKKIWGDGEDGSAPDPDSTKWQKMFDHLYKKWLPPLAPSIPGTTGGTSMNKIMAVVHDKQDYMGRSKNAMTTLADVFTGIKVIQVDFDTELFWQGVELKNQYQALVRSHQKIDRDVAHNKMSAGNGEDEKRLIEEKINRLLEKKLQAMEKK